MKFAISKVFLALLSACVAVEGHNVRIGEKETRAGGKEPRIVGGTAATAGEFPYYGKHGVRVWLSLSLSFFVVPFNLSSTSFS